MKDRRPRGRVGIETKGDHLNQKMGIRGVCGDIEGSVENGQLVVLERGPEKGELVE